MNNRSTLLLALLYLTVALLPASAAAQVRGHVTDAASGEPVAGALVWLAGGTIHMARSGPGGAYAFADVPAGSYCMQVDTPGYDSTNVCISVTATARMVVDLPLTIRPVVMPALLVMGVRGVAPPGAGGLADSLRASRMEQRLMLLSVQSSALAGAQLGDLMPATDQSGGSRPHTLYVWGSSAQRGRVLLDGASLSAPLHLGALLPPLDPNVIAAANVHSGGISPRYDGGTSYIMDYTTRPAADELRMWGELDLLAGRVGAEAPINGRGRLIMSARRVNDEIIDGLISQRFRYGYDDALARADLDVGGYGDVHLTALTTRESVNIPRDLGEDRASWINRAATLVWQREQGDDLRSATVSVSRGVADLPLLSAPGGHLESNLDRYSGLARRRWRSGSLGWDAGAEIEHLVFRRTSRATEDPATGDPGRTECTALLPCSHARTTLVSTFGELSLSPGHEVGMSFGARAMYDVSGRRLHILPRASMTFLPDEQWSVTLAGGRFSQAYVRQSPLSTYVARVDLPIDVDVAHATHLELGISRRSAGLYFHAGAYLRHHARIEPTMLARTVPGADLSLEYDTRAGMLSLAYSVSDDPGRAGEKGGGTGSIQQLATAGLHGERGRWSFDVTTSWGSGLPLTSIVLEQPRDMELYWQPVDPIQPGRAPDGATADRDYLRVDAMVGAEWRLGNEDRFRIMPYVRIVNALSQREALFYFQDDGDLTQPPRALARLPAVPMIGLRWNF